MKVINLLIVADSERNADMLYATGMFVPDPFIYLRLHGKSVIVMSDLEIDRARKQAPHCRVISFSQVQKQLRAAGVPRPGYADVVAHLLRQRRIQTISVPADFPLGLANELAARKVKAVAVKGGVFPGREIKSAAEVRKLVAALRMAEAGMAAGMAALRAAKIGRDRKLIYQGAPLTSGKLRSISDTAVLQAGGLAANTIVAGGLQGCDPHERGHGPLHAHEPIILDIFPRAQATGYFGDITRTVVRGRASEAVRKLYRTVHQGQQIGFKQIRAGVVTADVHRAVNGFFEQEGYRTGKRKGRMEGFFHGTGHGLGLEIHEAPRMGTSSTDLLKVGHVVTVEPGLYYPGIGGVRLEDVAVVTAKGARNITQFEKVLEV
jgi:Xaa-Pro aminopeptidase